MTNRSKVAILFYLFYMLTFYVGDSSINIMYTFEALSPRGCRSIEVHIYTYI
jgi:hypothetical protein